MDRLPQIAEHLKKLMFDPMFFSLNWFICLYTDKLSERVSLSILDFLFIRGSTILQNVGLAILLLLKPRILACQDFCKQFAINTFTCRGCILINGGSS